MNLLCPNCQKMLTVPDHFAGQLMKCPLCDTTFTAPVLPAGTAATPVAASPVTAPSLPPPLSPPPSPELERSSEPLWPPPPDPLGLSVPADSLPKPVPEVAPPQAPDVYALAPAPESPAPPKAPAPSTFTPTPPPPPPVERPVDLTPPPPSAPTEGYQHSHTLWVSPRVVPWMAPVGLGLVFLLWFFPWLPPRTIDVSVEGKEAIVELIKTIKAGSLSCWNLAFGSQSDLMFTFYWLLTFLALAAAIANFLFSRKVVPVPAVVQGLGIMRPLIVGMIALLAFLFIVERWVEGVFRTGMIPGTIWMNLAMLAQLVAITGAFLEFWLQRRGPGKPWPRVEIQW